MPLTVSQNEGLAVVTVTSNPKSKWPILCQILGYLCYTPLCSVSRITIGKLESVNIGLGIVQMIIGVINIALGISFMYLGYYFNMYLIAFGPFWIGSVVIVVGIVCVLAARFPSSCLLMIGMLMNIVSAALGITSIALYSLDLSFGHYRDWTCRTYDTNYYYSSYDRYRTPTPEESMRLEMCQYYNNLFNMICVGLDIMMIVLSVLQICVTISLCVLTGKTLCKKTEDEEEDPFLKKPLLDDDAVGVA
ncbi:transmembrane protein 176l.4 isoform 2 [Danio rerio]|uniref:Transmembrane protein 176l.4 n=1 Tax=Danio rerio TaxID=7955 RepID=F6NYJ2_DANRE|nr:transmembrane protein 176l.4 isoform 2 [Danio rerio]|eukprot:NP_001264248.1 transmembrane protein 176l.4 isoform 2 [Danio rerio]